MATPTVADYLKYANLQMAAEALYRLKSTDGPVTPETIYKGEISPDILTDGNLHASKFTATEATLSGLNSDWVVVEHKSNTTTGFSGTLFRNSSTNELVLSFRSTEFIDDAARDNTATNTLEIKEKGFAFGQINDMEVWYKHLTDAQLIPAGAKYSVTGYSLGGHLATAFNLLRQEDGTQDRVDNVYTFNGAGVGSVTQGTLGSVMQYFNYLRKDSTRIDVTIDNADLLSTYQTVRAGLTNASLTLSQAKTMIDRFSIPSALARNPDSLEYKAFIEDKTRISVALDRAIKVHDAAHSAPNLSSGDPLVPPKPANIPDDQIAGEVPDYQMAVLLAGERTTAIGIAGNAAQAVLGRSFGGNLSNQHDVMGQIYDGTNLSSPSAVANSQLHYGADEKIFIEDQPLYRGTIVDSITSQLLAFQDISLLVNQYSKNDFGDTHSLVLIVDSLNVQNLLQRLAPNATQSEIEDIFKAASNSTKMESMGTQGKAEGNVLETVLNALGDMLIGSSETWKRLDGNLDGGTWADISAREDFYKTLQAIITKTDAWGLLGKLTLGPADENLATSSKGDFSSFLALYTLSPFVLHGADNLMQSSWSEVYSNWSADQALSAADRAAGKAYFSDNWYVDRGELIGYWLQANNRNEAVLTGVTSSGLPATDQFVFSDVTSGQSLTVMSDFNIDGSIPTGKQSRHIVFGSKTGDTLNGDALSDHLYGGDGNDLLTGNSGNDYLEGGKGVDLYRFFQGDGEDSILDIDGKGLLQRDGNYLSIGVKTSDGIWTAQDVTYTRKDNDLAIGFSGSNDTITVKNFDFSAAGTTGYLGIHLYDLPKAPTAYDRTIKGDVSAIGGYDDLGNPVGTVQANRADLLYDSVGNDLIQSLGGDDEIRAEKGGNDRIEAGAGSDIVRARGGDDVVIGSTGQDLLRGDAGKDRLYAGEEMTIAVALQHQNDTASGIKGDLIDGGSEDDLLIGDTGNDALLGGGGNDLIIAGTGNDNIYGDSESSIGTRSWNIARSIVTQNGGTEYRSTATNISIPAPASGGNDMIFGGSGQDWVHAGWGEDWVDGGNDNDVLFGEHGSDILLGGAGNDALNGDNTDVATADQGNDYLDGGDGNDTLVGMGGDDVLIGGMGNDILIGGVGKDTYIFNKGDGIDHIVDTPAGTNDPEASVVLLGKGYSRKDVRFGVGSLLIDLGGRDAIHLDGFNPDNPSATPMFGAIQFANGDSMSYQDVLEKGFDIIGTESGDTLNGTAVVDRIQGLGGDDTIQGKKDNDVLLGGYGNDIYLFNKGDGDDQIVDTNGANTIRFGDGITLDDLKLHAMVAVGAQNLEITYDNQGSRILVFNGLQGGVDRYEFADGTVLSRDQLMTLASKALTASEGNDTLVGMGVADVLSGGGGNDHLLGNGGNDTLDGGDGDDQLDGGIGDDLLLGGTGNDILNGGAGHDVLNGGDGSDTYLLTWGMAQDAVIDNGTESDTVKLDQGIDFSSLEFQRKGDDLYLGIAGPRNVDFHNLETYGNTANRSWAEPAGFTIKNYFTEDKSWQVKTYAGDSVSISSLLSQSQDGGNIALNAYEQWVASVKQTYFLDASKAVLQWDHADLLPAGDNQFLATLLSGRKTYGIEMEAVSSDEGVIDRVLPNSRSAYTPNGTYSLQSISTHSQQQSSWTGEWLEPVYDDTHFDNNGNRIFLGFLRHESDGTSLSSDATTTITIHGSDTYDALVLETLTAGPSDNLIYLASAMAVNAGAGNDLIIGGSWGSYSPVGDYVDGGDGNDRILGSYDNDVILAGNGDDYLCGSDGDDTYLIDPNNTGTKIIDEVSDYVYLDGYSTPYSGSLYYTGGGSYSTDTVEFGSGVSLSDLTVSLSTLDISNVFSGVQLVSSSGNYQTTDISWGDGHQTIRILMSPNQTASPWSGGAGIEFFKFSDGTQLSLQEIIASADSKQGLTLIGTTGDDSLVGGDRGDTLSGNGGNDILNGGAGDDTYIVTSVDTNVHIVDSAGQDKLILQNVNLDGIQLGVGSLKITVLATGQEIHLDDFDPANPYAAGGVELFQFADGTVLTKTQLIGALGFYPTGTNGADTLSGTSLNDVITALDGDDVITALGGDDIVYGGGGSDILNGGTGNDFLAGGDGNDTYLFAAGDGQDRITDTSGIDRIVFATGILASQVQVSQSNGEVTLSIVSDGTTSDSVTFAENGPGSYAIEQVEFSDGSIWQAADILRALSVTPPSVDSPLADQAAVEDTLFQFTVPASTFSDADVAAGDSLTMSASLADGNPLPDWLSFDPATQTFSGTPGDGAVGSIALQVTVTDLAGNAVSSAFNLQVANVNDAPTGEVAIAGTGTQGAVLTATHTLSDGDGLGAIGYQWQSSSDGISWNDISGAIEGSFELTEAQVDQQVRVVASYTDGHGTLECVTSAATGAISNVNDAPTGDVTVSGEAVQGGVLSLSNTLSDADGLGAISYQWQASADGSNWADIEGQTASSLTLTQAEVGLQIRALGSYVDGHGTSEQVFSAATTAIANVNDVPVAGVQVEDQAATEDSAFTFTLPAGAFSDVDVGDSLSYGITLADGSALPAWLSFDAATATLQGTPTNGDVGSLNLRVTATDKAGATATQSFALLVANVNDAPVVGTALSDQSGKVGSSLSFALPNTAFTDVDGGDSLSYSANQADGQVLPSWLSFDATTQQFVGTPTTKGNWLITVTAKDLAGASASQTFSVAVAGGNAAPVVVDDTASASEDGTLFLNGNVLSNDTDVDPGTTLSLANAGTYEGKYGVLSLLANGSYGYVLNNQSQTVQALGAGVTAYDRFDYQASDGQTSAVGHLTIAVSGKNDTPTLTKPLDDYRVGKGNAFQLNVSSRFSDVDQGDHLTYKATLANGKALPTWVKFDGATGTFSGQTPAKDKGTLEITVTASDGHGASSSVSDSFKLAYGQSGGDDGSSSGCGAPEPNHGGGHQGDDHSPKDRKDDDRDRKNDHRQDERDDHGPSSKDMAAIANLLAHFDAVANEHGRQCDEDERNASKELRGNGHWSQWQSMASRLDLHLSGSDGRHLGGDGEGRYVQRNDPFSGCLLEARNVLAGSGRVMAAQQFQSFQGLQEGLAKLG